MAGKGQARHQPADDTSVEPARGFKDLGTTKLARQLGLTDEQTNGHWCSRCQGIWFGYTLEAECPVCGNRKG
jgi:rubrerythrin